MTNQPKAATGKISRKSLDTPATSCKSYIELPDGTLVDEEEYEAVQMIAELTKSIKELSKAI